MKNGPKYTLIVSVVIIVLAAILLVFGSTVAVDVESEAVFKGTEGTVSLSGDTSYTVFVNDQFDCYDTDVVITDGTSDYFNQDCDEFMDEEGWKHAGILPIGTSGDLEVISNHEIIIVDEIVYLESGGWYVNNGLMVLAPGAFVLLGLLIWIQRTLSKYVED